MGLQRKNDRGLEQTKALTKVLSGTHAWPLLPTWQDMDVLTSIHKALHPLQEFTDALSGEEYVSISYLKPVLHHLERCRRYTVDQVN